MDGGFFFLMSSTLSTTLLVIQQALYLVFGMLILVFEFLVALSSTCFNVILYFVLCFDLVLSFVLSWSPTVLEHGVFMFMYTAEHILGGGLAALWLFIELALSGGEIFAQILKVSVVVGWEGVYALFSSMYVGGSLLLSVLKQFGDMLLTVIQAVTWRESLVAVGLRWHEAFSVSSLSEVMIMCTTLVTQLFYIGVGLVIITTIGYIVKLIIVLLVVKRGVAVQVQADVEVFHNGESTLRRRATSKIHRRAPLRGNNPLRRSEPWVSKEVVDKGNLREDELLRERLSRLHSQLSEERDKNICVVCLDSKREVLLNPCKHYCLCMMCVINIRRCPVCNQEISATEKIYHV